MSRSSDLHPGIYQYDNKEGGFIGFDSDENSSSTLNTEELGYAMNSEDALYNAPAIIVISANIDRHPKKYANRGYRYTLLEVGHIAQNIHLSSLEIGLGSLEYGGFNDDKIAQILDFDKGEEALITIGVGHPESTKNKELKSLGLISKLEKKLIGKGKPIQSVLVDNHSNIVKELDFYRAISKYNPPNDGYNNTDELFAFGTAPSSEMAYIKAVAEAYERYKSGLVRFDVKDSAMNLDGDWLDPRIIKPLTDEQYSKLDGRLVKFNEELEIEWIKGHKKDGRSIYVPIDLVFYPLPKEIDYRRRVVTADSSGVAAYTDIEGATKNGLLELIERDATMRLWFNKIPPKRIDVKTLPDYYKKRAAYWKQKGRIVEFIDLSDNEKGIPIINVAIRAENDQYPFFVSGASANPNKKMALYKALCEAELGYSSVLNTEKIESIRPDEVESPIDHGKLYYTGTYADQIDWIWKGDFINWTEVCNTNNDKFIDKYDFIIVKLTQDMDPLQVVRVLCPELIPINFGYGNEHYSHSNNDSRVYDSSLPHFFA